MDKVLEIRNSDLPAEEKTRLIRETINTLEPTQARMAYDRLRIERNLRPREDSDETKAQAKTGEVALVEFTNLSQEFATQMALVTVVNYLLERLDGYDAEKRYKRAIRKFVQDTLGFNDGRHVGKAEELFNKRMHELHPAEIPEITEPFDNFPMSFDQLNNLYRYHDDRFEPNRILTRAIFGGKPSSECHLYMHGMFNPDKVDAYRISNAKQLRGPLIALPIGGMALVQPFDKNKEKLVIYNPDDVEVEIMLNQKRLIDLANNKQLSDRLEMGKSKVNDASMKKIAEYEDVLKMTNTPEYMNLDIDSKKDFDENLRLLNEEATKGMKEMNMADDETLVRVNYPEGPAYVPIKDEILKGKKDA